VTPVTTVTPDRRYRFGRYVLDAANRRLLLGGAPVDLPWRCFDALSLLVEAQSAVVDRDVLFQKLWPGLEVEETGLTKVMSQLRRVLAEGDPGVEYVETVTRIGYRLSVPVSPDNLIRVVNAAAGAPFVVPQAPAKTATLRRRFLWAGAAAILVLAVLAGYWGWNRYQRLAEADRASKEGQRLRRLGREPNALNGAIASFLRATQLDPGNARYFGELAAALSLVPYAGRTEWSAARDAAERGVQLDRECAGCQAVLGFLLFSRFWEWDRAETHLREALRLAPKAAGNRGYMAMYLASQARLEEALKHGDEAVRLEPYSATLHSIRALVLFFLRRYPESWEAAGRSLSIDPRNAGAWDARAFALLQAGREQEALSAWLEVQWPDRERELEAAFRTRGIRASLSLLLDATTDGKLRETNVYRRARWRMYLGDPAGALDELELALKTQHFNLMYVAADPMFEGLRAHPRFARVLADMRLRRTPLPAAASPQ
jgi:DNA-binding winged helix-turn-helix (wHTH) protein/tetratricopeptide (TPR) repeat protein